MTLPDDADISCHLQEVSKGAIYCNVPEGNLTGETNRVTPEACYACPAGKVYREVGCDQVIPDILIRSMRTLDQVVGYDALVHVYGMNCARRLRPTTLEECHTCTLVSAETTREVVSVSLGLFQAQGFDSAYNDLLEARNELRDGDYDDAIGKAIVSLESTMRCVHEELGVELPAKRTVTGLWQSTKDILRFDEFTTEARDTVIALVGSLTGAISSLGSMRNALSDSHGRGLIPVEVSEALAELAINSSASIATVIIRRYKQLTVEE